MTPAEALSTLLATIGASRPSDGKWASFRCPAHGGRSTTSGYASLQNGIFIAKCFNGCTMTEILTSVGMNISDIEQPKTDGNNTQPQFKADEIKPLPETERHKLEADTETILQAYIQPKCYGGVLADHLRALEHSRVDVRTEQDIQRTDELTSSKWREELSARNISKDWNVWRNHIASKEHGCEPDSLNGLVGIIFGSHTIPSVRKMRLNPNTIGFVYPLRYPKRTSPPFSWKAVWWEETETGDFVKKKKNMPDCPMMPYSIFAPHNEYNDKQFDNVVFLVEGEGDAATLAGMGAKAASSGSKQRVVAAMTGLCHRLNASGKKDMSVVCIPDYDIGSGAKTFAEAQRLAKNDFGVDASVVNIGMLASVSEGDNKPKDVRDFALMFGIDELRKTLLDTI